MLVHFDKDAWIVSLLNELKFPLILKSVFFGKINVWKQIWSYKTLSPFGNLSPQSLYSIEMRIYAKLFRICWYDCVQ